MLRDGFILKLPNNSRFNRLINGILQCKKASFVLYLMLNGKKVVTTFFQLSIFCMAKRHIMHAEKPFLMASEMP